MIKSEEKTEESLAENLNHRRRKVNKARNTNLTQLTSSKGRKVNKLNDVNMTYFPSLKLSNISAIFVPPTQTHTTKNSENCNEGIANLIILQRRILKKDNREV